MRKFLSFLTGAVMGALVGATVALLLAPFSGEELRGQLQQRLATLRDELTEAASSRKIELEKQLSKMRQPSSSIPVEDASKE